MTDMDKAKELWLQTCHGRWMSEEYEPGLVSVIIPTYNRAHMVTEAMDSVWNQTHCRIELIVVDDRWAALGNVGCQEKPGGRKH